MVGSIILSHKQTNCYERIGFIPNHHSSLSIHNSLFPVFGFESINQIFVATCSKSDIRRISLSIAEKKSERNP